MENFDDVVTDPRLHLEQLEQHVNSLNRDSYFLGQYRVIATAGTSGLRGIFAYNRREWSVVIANTLRWGEIIGLRPNPLCRVKVASIGADTPMHVSCRLSLSSGGLFFKMLQLDATQPLSDLIDALNDLQPEVLLPYSSIAHLLALEQLEGHLSIAPRLVATHSEVLTDETRERIREAWGISAFNHYGMTEEPHIATDCGHLKGLHLLEDLCMVEIADDDLCPVSDGSLGSRFLLTNLYNYTQPLIRYEVTDLVARAKKPCPCGRPFSLVTNVEGRREDLLYLKAKDGKEITLSPMIAGLCVERVEGVKEYEIKHSADQIRVFLIPKKGLDRNGLAKRVQQELETELSRQGARPPAVSVEIIEKIRRSKDNMGKHHAVAREIR